MCSGFSATQTSVSQEICVKKLRMTSRVENAVTKIKPALHPENSSFSSLHVQYHHAQIWQRTATVPVAVPAW